MPSKILDFTMAEEEVDVLGDFKLELDYGGNDLGDQGSDPLGSELSHPWLMETSPWYLDHSTDEHSRQTIEKMLQEERQHCQGLVGVGNRSTTELDIGRGNIEKWTTDKEVYNVFETEELFHDTEIPTSVEEVIMAFNTSQPTLIEEEVITTNFIENKKKRQKSESSGSGRYKKSSKCRKIQKHKTFKNKRASDEHFSDKYEDVINIKPIDDAEKQRVVITYEGEEVVRMQKENTESDSDISIDCDDDDNVNSVECPLQIVTNVPRKMNSVPIKPTHSHDIQSQSSRNAYHHEVLDTISQLTQPLHEVQIDSHVISEQEIEIHEEFFQGSALKTRERYLKIRNHLYDTWLKNKPHYVSKTFARQGLKNCGDVNSIGRIHAYLEQIGAINFGCEQTQYNRAPPPYTPDQVSHTKQDMLQRDKITDTVRQRKKTTFFDCMGSESEMTYEHGENEEIIQSYAKPTTQAPPKLQQREPREKREKNPFKLIPCQDFEEDEAPFQVHMDICAMVIMDLHSHSCHTEVIGLLGGHYNHKERRLTIKAAEPCKSTSTSLQCEMCPVSQFEASQSFTDSGLEVVGWYHSHPTFIPNPSIRDLESQEKFQDLFARQKETPFVSIIVSPYYIGKSLMSQFRCLTVVKEDTIRMPYKFTVTLFCSAYFDIEMFINQVKKVLEKLEGCPSLVPLKESYKTYSSMTYLGKMLESSRLFFTQVISDTGSVESILQSVNDLYVQFLDKDKLEEF